MHFNTILQHVHSDTSFDEFVSNSTKEALKRILQCPDPFAQAQRWDQFQRKGGNKRNFGNHSKHGGRAHKQHNNHKPPRYPQHFQVNNTPSPSTSFQTKIHGFRKKQFLKKHEDSSQTNNSLSASTDGKVVEKEEFDKRIMDLVRTKLNKLSSQNYTRILNFLIELLQGKTETFIKGFMEYFMDRALMEKCYLALYINLCVDLSETIPLIREILELMHSKFMGIFDTNLQLAEHHDDYDQFTKDMMAKTKRETYSSLLMNLYKHQLISPDTYWNTVTHLSQEVKKNCQKTQLKELNEEYCVAITSLIIPFVDAFGEAKYISKITPNIVEIIDLPKSERSALPLRGYFRLMDIKDKL